MSSPSPSPPPRPSRHGRQPLFFRDLASPISAARGASGSAGGRFAGSASGLWREGLAATGGPETPPPPPAFTLDDRATDFSPEAAVGELPLPSPGARSRTPPAPARGGSSPLSRSPSLSSPSAFRARVEVNGGTPAATQKTPDSSSWLHALRSVGGGESEKGREGSPVDGVVLPGALITLPPRGEVARVEVQRSGLPNGGGCHEEEWVTVFGFLPGDTNLVLREFEKCGRILKHIPGPRDANWMHILYQNHYDAQKALRKNGTQINSILIIGVKPVDPMHRQSLNERLNEQRGFMVSLPSKSSSALAPVVPRPYQPQTSTGATTGSGRRSSESLASPAKSVVSKVMDLIFGT